MEAKIKLEYPDKDFAKAVSSALSPDNSIAPTQLSVETKVEDSTVLTEIKCGGTLATFTATIDDLLFSASTADKTLKIIRKV